MKKELTLREIQLSSLEILKYIDKICRENNWKYFLAYGTLIGAVRHQGFIPWDDDIDIWMPREDYEKFKTYCKNNTYRNYKLFTIDDKKYPYIISRLSDTKYTMICDNEEPCGMGTFVDIYPLDELGDSYEKICKRKKKTIKLASLCFLSTRKKFEMGHTKSLTKKFLKLPAYILAKIIGKKKLINAIMREKEKSTNKKGKYIGCFVWGTHIHKDIYKKVFFTKAINLQFEDYIFLAPSKYNELLQQIYGDYMKIPEKKDRVAHHDYKIYKKDNA